VALLQNINALPFTNERLAASVGKSAAEFDAAPLTDAAVNVVFDALAESKNGLVLPLPLPLPPPPPPPYPFPCPHPSPYPRPPPSPSPSPSPYLPLPLPLPLPHQSY